MTSQAFLTERLAAIEAQGLLRRPPVLLDFDGVQGRVGDRDVLVFCSNDYLGFRFAEEVISGASRAAERYGAGSGSSRLIAGSLAIHRDLEEELALWLGTEAALVFSSGYQANLGLLQALAGPEDLVLSDRLNHASLIDGCRLARARFRVLPHGDAGLISSLSDRCAGQCFVVGEGLYSMDGDRGAISSWLDAISALPEPDRAHLLVDEAHSLGVLGPEGAGVAAESGRSGDLLARVGTFGKALGSHGAFVVGSAALREYLVNRSRTFIFTTGLPPASAGAALEALRLVRGERGEEARGVLQERICRFRTGLSDLGLSALSDPDSPIVPVLVGGVGEAMQLSDALLAQGIFATAIRPPTVPQGTARIRFALSALHSEEDVDRALYGLSEAIRAVGPLPASLPRP